MTIHPEELITRASRIRVLALDVDGVLTDGRLYFGNTGEELKAFSTLDGLGIKLLQNSGIPVALITARSSALLERRAQNLGIAHVQQGSDNKLRSLQELLRQLALDLHEAAYVGDDLPDLACIRRAGLGIAVSNAHEAVREQAAWVTTLPGGNGAVREVCDLILKAQGNYAAALAPFETGE